MGILQLPMQVPAMVGILPNQKFMVTTDNLGTVTTAGYLNQVSLESNPLSNTDILQVLYSFNQQTTVGTYGLFTVSISGTGTITLAQASLSGDVNLPTIANNIIVSTNTTGTIGNLTGTAINAGSLQAGSSGVAGTLISFPATASKGSLIIAGVANTGNTTTTLSNDAMGQASVINIPDPANAIGQLLIGATATPFVSGNFIQASGTAGLVVDSGLAVANIVAKNAVNVMASASKITLAKGTGTEVSNAVTISQQSGVITTVSLSTAQYATETITLTNTLIATTSVVIASIMGGTNTTPGVTVSATAGSGTSTIVLTNTNSAALNGTVIIGFAVF